MNNEFDAAFNAVFPLPTSTKSSAVALHQERKSSFWAGWKAHEQLPTQQPEHEAVPAKVASVDAPQRYFYLIEYGLGVMRKAEHGSYVGYEAMLAWHNAKLAEALNRQAKLIHQGYLRLMNELQQRAEKAEADRDQWEAQHADMVKRCALLRGRDDLPVDRIPAYQELVRLQSLAAQVPQAGQAPVAWAYECKQPCPGDVWAEFITREAPREEKFVRNTLPLYAAPPTVPQQAGQELVIGAGDPEAVFALFCETNGYPSDSEMDGALRGAFYEGIKYCCRTAPPAIPQQAGQTVDERIIGTEVSIDVSTGDADAHHRYFGTVCEVMEHDGKNGTILLVQDEKPNFNIGASLAAPSASAAPVDPIVELNVAMLRDRSAVGIAKYGTTLADNPLSLQQWLSHALEESLDQANYLQAAIQKLAAAVPPEPKNF